MNHLLGYLHYFPLNREKFREYMGRNARILSRLPKSDEVRFGYHSVIDLYVDVEKQPEQAWKLLQTWQREAERYHDLDSLALIQWDRAWLWRDSGELRKAIPHYEQSLELCNRMGHTLGRKNALEDLATTYLLMGDLSAAEAHARHALESAADLGLQHTAGPWLAVGHVALCQQLWNEAQDAFGTAIQAGDNYAAYLGLGQTHLVRGEREEAVISFQRSLVHAAADHADLRRALSRLEEALDDPDAFRAACLRIREEHPDATVPLTQWLLEKTTPLAGTRQQIRDQFDGFLGPEWSWHDPLQDGSFVVGQGLEIHAANGRDLWHINWSAPRLLRPVSGEFAIQTICVPATPEKPAIGGLLLWRDRDNYLHLTRGQEGEHQVAFAGCIEKEDRMIGRGRLQADRMSLRLERCGDCVHALCSADGTDWFTAGRTQFPIGGPVEVGLHAIGTIDRTIYPGACPDGTAIRFERFELW
jgi:tetratricopeptide (TPR) repeat protein